MDLKPGLVRVGKLDVNGLLRQVADLAKVFVLPGHKIQDRASFFDAIRETFPLDPELYGHDVWDALSDSLWGGIDGLDCGRVVILWPNSKRLAEAAPDDFATALEVLEGLAKTLGDPKYTVGRPKQVSVMVGDD